MSRVEGPLVLAVPSKGRLMDDTQALLHRGGLRFQRTGHERGYKGEIAGLPGVEVQFLSASEIAAALKAGKAHLGVTGEDLIQEQIPDAESRVSLAARLGFGHADVVVAVPDFWIDVRTMAELEEAAIVYRRRHGRRMRVATKYMSLTRRFFAGHRIGQGSPRGDPVTVYRIIESLGATEGAPAAGTAELIVDISSTGATLRANGLRVLEDGLILRSEACLVVSQAADWSGDRGILRDRLVAAAKSGLAGA
jgi:ATP phosphoribosyltransferase